MTKVFIQRKILSVDTVLSALEIRLKKTATHSHSTLREKQNDRMSIQISYKHLTVQPWNALQSERTWNRKWKRKNLTSNSDPAPHQKKQQQKRRSTSLNSNKEWASVCSRANINHKTENSHRISLQALIPQKQLSQYKGESLGRVRTALCTTISQAAIGFVGQDFVLLPYENKPRSSLSKSLQN